MRLFRTSVGICGKSGNSGSSSGGSSKLTQKVIHPSNTEIEMDGSEGTYTKDSNHAIHESGEVLKEKTKSHDHVYQVIDSPSDISLALQELRDAHNHAHTKPKQRKKTKSQNPQPSPLPSLAVDCEGVNLSRDGTITIVSVATRNKVYLFDVQQLGAVVFDAGLREILEDPNIFKLMFDCRKDSDALLHLFGVQMRGMLDLQLMVAMLFVKSNSRVVYFQKYAHVLKTYSEEFVAMKQEEGEVWKHSDVRPLTQELIDYCIADTKPFFNIYEKLLTEKNVSRNIGVLKVASQMNADFFRAFKVLPVKRGGYNDNGYLSIPLLSVLKGEEEGLVDTWREGYERCVGCLQFVAAKYVNRKSCYCWVCHKIFTASA